MKKSYRQNQPDRGLYEKLICPKHRSRLSVVEGSLYCQENCGFPIIEGIPVLLLEDFPQTLGVAVDSLREAKLNNHEDPFFIETLGISCAEKFLLRERVRNGNFSIDPVVALLVGATNGIAYKGNINNIDSMPIPNIRLENSMPGQILLDIGCNWGRWSIAAANKGYRVVGVDPSLGTLLAAKRITERLGLDAKFVCGDARFLPFSAESFERIFSYSVIQHFSYQNAEVSFSEIGRVLKKGGSSMIQMPTKFGIRCLFHQIRRRFRGPINIEVRYWTIAALKKKLGSKIGHTTISVDCFFGIGLQPTDLKFMSLQGNLATIASEIIRKLTKKLSAVKFMADSVYLNSTK